MRLTACRAQNLHPRNFARLHQATRQHFLNLPFAFPRTRPAEVIRVPICLFDLHPPGGAYGPRDGGQRADSDLFHTAAAGRGRAGLCDPVQRDTGQFPDLSGNPGRQHPTERQRVSWCRRGELFAAPMRALHGQHRGRLPLPDPVNPARRGLELDGRGALALTGGRPDLGRQRHRPGRHRQGPRRL